MSCTNLVNETVVYIQSTLMDWVHLMFSVTKQHLGEDGQYSRREWTARLIFTVAGLNTNEGSVI